jgi:leucyl aminopeptidase
MKVKFEVKKIKDVKADVLVSAVFEDQVDSKLHWLNTLFKGNLDAFIHSNDFKGNQNELQLTYLKNDSRSNRLLVVGVGRSKEITTDKLRRAYAVAAKKVKKLKFRTLAFELPDLTYIKNIIGLSINEIVQAITEGIFLSQYSFNKYITKNETETVEEIIFFTDSPKYVKEINDAIKLGHTISDAVFVARDLGNEPSNQLTPGKFAEHVKKLSVKANYTVTVFDEKKIKQLNMGGVIGVSQGSVNPPKFLILQYFGNLKSDKPIVLVGKGVTFDSGGISLKPAGGMEAMKMDMCGAAAVVGAFESVSRLNLKVNVIGLIPLVENMPDGNAMRPGDIIKGYSGISIEVANTDAEGRLILADALAYAANYKPKAVIDIATLTGAAVVTFGHLITGMMGNDNDLKKKLFAAGERTYERLWELPLYEEYEKLMKSDVADIKNIGAARQAGTIMGGIFLKKFVGDSYPWVHLDVAGTAMVPEPSEYNSKDATGFGVRLFTDFLMHYNSK